MSTSPISLAILVLCIFALAVYINKHTHKDIDIPMPSKLRTDLLYGYYGRVGDQVARTTDHTNLLWECQFEGPTLATNAILEARKFTVLDVCNQMFYKFAEHGRNFRIRPEARANLTDFFSQLQEAGALKYVKAITVLDEPNTNAETYEELYTAYAIVLDVASKFPELQNVGLATIYAREPATYPCVEKMDYAGMDDYDSKSSLLQSKEWSSMRKQLKPGAKLIVLPGGAFGQDPEPFLAYAHSDNGVGMIVPFTWLGPMQPKDTWVGLGDDANPLKQQYIKAGMQTIGASK